jgi:hypothetical protein
LAGRDSRIPPYQVRDLHHLGLPLAFIEWACYQAKRPLSGHAQIRPFVRVFSNGSISGALLPEDNVGNREEIINVHNFLAWVFDSEERIQKYLACRSGFGSTTEYLREYLLPKVNSYMRKDIDNYSVNQPALLDYANEQSPESFESFVAIIEQALSKGYLISPLMDWKIYDPELQSVYGIPRHIVLIQGSARDGKWIVYDPARPRSSKHSYVEPIHVWNSLSKGRFNVLGLVSR